jgi:PAS domain S-box-containing protein
MKDDNKTKKQLVRELTELRSQNAALNKSITGGISAELAAEEARRYAESIVETVREPLLVLDADLKIISANGTFYRTFKVTPGETIGSFIYDLGNKQWNIPKLRELLEETLPKKEAFDDFEVAHNFQDIGHKIMLLNARQIYRKDIGAKMILLAIEDITERREIENGLEKARKELEVTKISEDEAREYAESIINTVREPLIALDQDLRVVTASRSFYGVFKVKPEETVGQLIYDLGNKQWNIPKLRELLENILPEKTSFDNYEVEHDFATIGWRLMLLNARQIQRVLGKERIILLAIEDITERREIENGLERARKKLEVTKISEDEAREYAESIINTVREPLIALDQDLRVVTASRSFYGVFKVKPEETLGQLIYDLGNKQWNIPKLRELLENILPEKTTFENYEVEHDFANIGRRIMLLNARQIKRVLGKERIILLAIEDITEHKRLESLLTESEERFRRLFETASDGIVLLEKREGKITHANPATEKMLGYAKKESVGNKLQDIGVLLDMGDFQTLMQNLNKSGIINYNDVPVKTKSGQHIYTDIYLVDRARLVQCNIRDITNRKQAEEGIHASLREKEILLKELHHRVKNNMEVISGLLDLHARSSGNPELIEMLNKSQGRIRSMALVHEQLHASKDLARIDMVGYVRALSEELFQAYKIDPGKIDLIVQTDGNVYVDINKAIPCGLILNELVSNALKHAFPGDGPGELRIIIHETKNKEIEIVVRDNGLGLPDDVDIHQPRSMGLYLVNGLVKKQLEGQIEVRRDNGTEFRIKFPL